MDDEKVNRVAAFLASMILLYSSVYIGWPVVKIFFDYAINYPKYACIDTGPEHLQWFMLVLTVVSEIVMILMSFMLLSYSLFGFEEKE